MGESLNDLRNYLASLPQGKIDDVAELERQLASCWAQLAGSGEGGMAGYKLSTRTEEMDWNPPLLTFTIERHGAAALGSKYAELQSWTVDVDSGSAQPQSGRRRLVSPLSPRVDVKPIADEIAVLILAGKEDSRLKWYGHAKVRILIGRIFPAGSAVKQTLTGRRKRFKGALTERLEKVGWRVAAVNTFVTD